MNDYDKIGQQAVDHVRTRRCCMKKLIVMSAGLVFLAGCDGSTTPGNGGNVAVKFSAIGSPALRASGVSAYYAQPASDLTVTGTNGTLLIDDIRFIVEELELESSESSSVCNDDDEHDDDLRVSADEHSGRGGDDDEDDNEDEDDDECEFEGGPFIVDLPLDGSGVATITTENVPAGTYDSFKFKIDDLEADDGDNDDEAAKTPSLLSDIRAAYPNFPSRASMVVHGAQNGTPFTVYFRSKIRISQAITPPLVVPGDGTLTVHLDPSMWFKIGGQVLDLAALNGRLVDLGNFNHGITGIHHGDDD